MIALWIFLFLSVGYFFGQWNWNVYYDNKPNRFKTLLFPISANHCGTDPAFITTFVNRRAYSITMTFLWPIKIILLCCEWLTIRLTNVT